MVKALVEPEQQEALMVAAAVEAQQGTTALMVAFTTVQEQQAVLMGAAEARDITVEAMARKAQ